MYNQYSSLLLKIFNYQFIWKRKYNVSSCLNRPYWKQTKFSMTKFTRGTLPVDVYRLGQFTFQGQHLVNPIIALIHSTHTVTLFIDIYDSRVGERRVFIVMLSWIMSRGQWQGAMRAPPALEKPERQPRTDALSAFPR